MQPFWWTLLAFGTGFSISLYRYFSCIAKYMPETEAMKSYGLPVLVGAGMVGGLVVAGVSVVFPVLSVHSWSAAALAVVASWGLLTAYTASKTLRGLVSLVDKGSLKSALRKNKDHLFFY